jgi:hypothetical protein
MNFSQNAVDSKGLENFSVQNEWQNHDENDLENEVLILSKEMEKVNRERLFASREMVYLNLCRLRRFPKLCDGMKEATMDTILQQVSMEILQDIKEDVVGRFQASTISR